ncbi:MAG: hypothetical protein KIC54_02720 [Clostridium sp.]|nr:hypothetical protein [Clostridium sp.]
MLKQYGVQDNLIEKEKRINPDTPIADLNPDVVIERIKGLEWIIDSEEDFRYIGIINLINIKCVVSCTMGFKIIKGSNC